jgi:hypothetical protein
MTEDYLETALERADQYEAARRREADCELREAATPHVRDSALCELLASFVSKMPHDTAIPFVEHSALEALPSRRWFGKAVTPPPRQERRVRAHGWVIPRFGRQIYATDPPNAGAMTRLGLGVTTTGEPVFVTSGRALLEANLGPFTFQKLDVRDHPLHAKALGPITVENKCGAILNTLRLHYEDQSAIGQRMATPDQGKEMLTALANEMAELVRAAPASKGRHPGAA